MFVARDKLRNGQGRRNLAIEFHRQTVAKGLLREGEA